MSRSIKISTLDQAEDYINRQANQMRILEGKLRDVTEEAKREAKRITEARMTELREEMGSLEDSLNSQIEGLGSEMAKMDSAHRRLMKEQADKFYDSIYELKDWTETTIDALENRVQDSLDQQQRQIDKQRERIDHLYQKEADITKKAKMMLKDLQLLYDAVDKRSFHHKYAPGKLNQLKRRINSISEPETAPQAVIANVLSITNDLWDLEEEILKVKLRFEAVYNLALKEAIELLETMNRNRKGVFFTDENGENIKNQDNQDIHVELDFWTKGEYGELENRGGQLKKRLEDGKDKPELDEEKVKQILLEIAEIKCAQEDLISTAVERGLASEERVKISEDIINAMVMQGFELKTLNNGNPAHNYLGGEVESDQREGVFAILRNGVGTEISIIVHPDETLTKNQIVFQRNDDSSLTQTELRSSIEEVKNIIDPKGSRMGTIASPVGTGDVRQAELADGRALEKVGLSKSLRKQLGFTK